MPRQRRVRRAVRPTHPPTSLCAPKYSVIQGIAASLRASRWKGRRFARMKVPTRKSTARSSRRSPSFSRALLQSLLPPETRRFPKPEVAEEPIGPDDSERIVLSKTLSAEHPHTQPGCSVLAFRHRVRFRRSRRDVSGEGLTSRDK